MFVPKVLSSQLLGSLSNPDATRMAETEEQLPTIADDLVVTKYKMAAEIVNGKSEPGQQHRWEPSATPVVERQNLG